MIYDPSGINFLTGYPNIPRVFMNSFFFCTFILPAKSLIYEKIIPFHYPVISHLQTNILTGNHQQ